MIGDETKMYSKLNIIILQYLLTSDHFFVFQGHKKYEADIIHMVSHVRWVPGSMFDLNSPRGWMNHSE